ncbi:MAG: hypothetical protein JW768_08880 [Chitinispirillaceae bacterium]|nr:hypothetical protein [Chitinispirillaceae bacterium]
MAGFEIDNTWISFHSIYKILRPIEGIQDIHHQLKSAVCFVFTFQGEKCVIRVPSGKKDRFWIGVQDNHRTAVDITPLRKAFQEYKQPNKWLTNLLAKKIDDEIT